MSAAAQQLARYADLLDRLPVIEYLTLDYALALVADLGAGPVRDIGLLDSAVHRPQVSMLGRDASFHPARGPVSGGAHPGVRGDV